MQELYQGDRSIPTNVGDYALLVLRKDITIDKLKLNGFRDHEDGLGMFTGAFVQSDAGKPFLLMHFDYPRDGGHDWGGIEIRTNHYMYQRENKADILKSLGLTEADVYWENPDIEQQFRKQMRTKWRLRIQYAIILALFFWKPIHCLLWYSIISYVFMAYILFWSGDFEASPKSRLGKISMNLIVWLLSPITFAYLLLWSAFVII